ncbi:glycosyl hydrolase, glucoamylase [Terriglobus roseus DSM 18391]|uniref:Glycosyl hydrolase, glucoamylase n=1 Tax=Terriglobus roseus (strain DSM 18391 / NRRL B-41598 / KBS 63) TaxID=926566 RepID=I3ZD64_TERRK|nr:glycoside hydrolase family 15 protein [Terriglobus roseus]AFL87182.1 glycosyl hydrolase, glucoamylase [Terriglobus roseus DSM 18391]
MNQRPDEAPAIDSAVTPPLHGARIEDYALIGDCETAALVCKDGSVDWLCWPNFSSGACFAALLGTADNGYFKIKPAADETITGEDWRYKPHTLIVEKQWVTQNGEVLVSDFMPPRGNHSDVVRIVRGIRGTVKMRMDLVLRFDYGRTIPWVQRVDHHMRAIAGPELVVLRTEVPLRGEDLSTVSDFDVREGESVCFVLSYGLSTEDDPANFDAYDAYAETEKFWLDWTDQREYRGEYDECVERSLITLKALTYRPTGGLVAAPTTSLPELIGGERNWDYRFCWLRDTAFTLLVLLHEGFTEEALAWRGWLLRAIAGSAQQIQSLYGISGERQLTEWTADWLRGYEDSKPVNIGNKAANQVQLDVYGEVIAALSRVPVGDDDMWTPAIRSMVTNMLDHLADIWERPDSGIWETRGPEQHFVHSKMMAWVAFQSAIKAYEAKDHGDEDAETRQRFDAWRKVRDQIHGDVCDKGFDKELNSFVQAYGSKSVDAALLRIPLVGFLPASDPRVQGTVAAIEQRLMKNGLLLRYDTADGSDGLPPGEGAFLACSFWLVGVQYLSGRVEEAHALYKRLIALRNPLGLIAEEYDTVGKRQVGNFPQAFTHLTMAHAAVILSGGTGPWSEVASTNQNS